MGRTVDSQKTLLFLDEIQAAPELLAKLRWFAEDLPELPVIAAGSLLDFVLEQHDYSMPVGRISYFYLEPMSFEEFLLAQSQETLQQYLERYEGGDIPLAIHEQLITLFKEYLIVGGMPAAVSLWAEEKSLQSLSRSHHDLMATYRDDFAKYRGKVDFQRLEEILLAIPKMLGEKIVYSKMNRDVPSQDIKEALLLLNCARVCHRVVASSANGIPLASELRGKFFKEIFLDTGLISAALGVSLSEIRGAKEIDLINCGGLAEQVVGQLLRTIFPPYIEPALYYWLREAKGASAQIDYVIQYGNQVIPIEVKAGSTGSLKSLHYFMGVKQRSFAVRINSDVPSETGVKVTNQIGQEVNYTLLSLPFYLIEQLHRLLGRYFN